MGQWLSGLSATPSGPAMAASLSKWLSKIGRSSDFGQGQYEFTRAKKKNSGSSLACQSRACLGLRDSRNHRPRVGCFPWFPQHPQSRPSWKLWQWPCIECVRASVPGLTLETGSEKRSRCHSVRWAQFHPTCTFCILLRVFSWHKNLISQSGSS